MESRNVIQMNQFAMQKYSQRLENKLMVNKVGSGVGMNWDIEIDTYTLMCIYILDN